MINLSTHVCAVPCACYQCTLASTLRAGKIKLVKHYQDKQGRQRVTGDPALLQKSGAYPTGFGYAMSP